MARAGCGRARGARRRPPTWEISDSDAEGPSGAAAGAGTQGPAAEALRPERALKRLAVGVDPAILEDAGADVLLQALGALGCQCRIEPQRRPRSLCWSWGTPDPCPRSAPPEEREEPELLSLLLLEPEEFLQGAARLAQVQRDGAGQGLGAAESGVARRAGGPWGLSLEGCTRDLGEPVSSGGVGGTPWALSPGKQSHCSQKLALACTPGP